MNNLHIERVVLADDGIIVTYTDQTSAFYHESILLTHLAQQPRPLALKKPARREPGPSAQAQRPRRKVA